MKTASKDMMKMFQIHNYMVGDVLSKSKFSKIRYTRKEDDSKEYIAKCLNKHLVSHSILQNETILAPLLMHPNILPVREVIDTQKLLIQISELYPNGDLLSYITTKHSYNAENFISQIFNGINYLHQHYICHRDLKLENILVADDHLLKIGDFGFATITFDGLVSGSCGSYQYVSPEAFQGGTYNGFKADIWSLGVVTYCILAKKFPYSDISSLQKIDYSKIPEKWRPLLQKMLSIDPEKRPSIKECLSYTIFGASAKQPKPINISEPIYIFGNEILSRISQIFNKSASEVQTELHKEGPSLIKLISALFVEREKKDKDGNLIQPFRCHSMPLPSLPLSINTELYTKSYAADCNDVLTKISNYLFPLNACISNPTTACRSIVLNTQTQKECVPFDCVQSREHTTDLSFTISPENRELVLDICKELDSAFLSPKGPMEVSV